MLLIGMWGHRVDDEVAMERLAKHLLERTGMATVTMHEGRAQSVSVPALHRLVRSPRFAELVCRALGQEPEAPAAAAAGDSWSEYDQLKWDDVQLQLREDGAFLPVDHLPFADRIMLLAHLYDALRDRDAPKLNFSKDGREQPFAVAGYNLPTDLGPEAEKVLEALEHWLGEFGPPSQAQLVYRLMYLPPDHPDELLPVHTLGVKMRDIRAERLMALIIAGTERARVRVASDRIAEIFVPSEYFPLLRRTCVIGDVWDGPLFHEIPRDGSAPGRDIARAVVGSVAAITAEGITLHLSGVEETIGAMLQRHGMPGSVSLMAMSARLALAQEVFMALRTDPRQRVESTRWPSVLQIGYQVPEPLTHASVAACREGLTAWLGPLGLDLMPQSDVRLVRRWPNSLPLAC